MGKYLDLLEAEIAEKHSAREPSKPSKPGFEGFEGTAAECFSPPLSSNGVPCGPCPSCGQGEFWRWPKFHPKHDPRGWVCWFCSPPPAYSGPCDFCGVPEKFNRVCPYCNRPLTEIDYYGEMLVGCIGITKGSDGE